MKKINLEITKEDIVDADYGCPNDCAISKALNRLYVLNYAGEGVWYVRIQNHKDVVYRFEHNRYNNEDFVSDLAKATVAKDNEVIRTIVLTYDGKSGSLNLIPKMVQGNKTWWSNLNRWLN